MKTNHVRLVSLLSLCLAGAAVAQQEGRIPSFNEIDTDENGQVSLAEAEQSSDVARLFGELDTNNDGQLSNEEFNEIELVGQDQ